MVQLPGLSLEVAIWLPVRLTTGWSPGLFIVDKGVGFVGGELQVVGQSSVFTYGPAIVHLHSISQMYLWAFENMLLVLHSVVSISPKRTSKNVPLLKFWTWV